MAAREDIADGGALPSSEDEYEHYDDATGSFGCGCFGRFCRDRGNGYLRWRQEEEEIRDRENWAKKAAMKLREVSEILAGPKWKNFIRRFGINRKRKMNFQYDPQSYALNFDEGVNRGEDEINPTFSSRFVAPIGTR